MIEDKKEARRQERQALAEGRMPDSLKNWKPYGASVLRSGAVLGFSYNALAARHRRVHFPPCTSVRGTASMWML